MAEDPDNPEMEIRIKANWSEFEQSVAERNRQGIELGTFANETGRGRGGSITERLAAAVERQTAATERATRALPYYGAGGSIVPYTQLAVYQPMGGGWTGGPPFGGGGGGGGGGGRYLPGPGSGPLARRNVVEGEELPPYETVETWEGAGTPGPPYGPPRPPRGEEPGKRPGGFSQFYMRFLALEAFRMGSDILYSYRDQSIKEGMSMGDPGKLALAGLQFQHDIAASLPFGVGKLGLYLRDPTGQEELSVTMPLAQAAMNDQITAARQTYGQFSQELRRSGEVSGQVGFSQQNAQITANRERRDFEIHNQTNRLTTIATQRWQAERNEIQNTQHYNGPQWVRDYFPNIGKSFLFRREVNEEDFRGIEDARSAEARRIGQEQRDNYAQSKQTETLERKNLEYSNFLTGASISAAGASAGDYADDMSTPERRRRQLGREQGVEILKTLFTNPFIINSVLENQKQDRRAMEFDIARGETDFTITMDAGIAAANRMGANDPLGAETAKLEGQKKLALNAPGLTSERRQKITQYYDALQSAAKNQTERQERIQQGSLQNDIVTMGFILARDPLSAQNQRVIGERDAAIAGLKHDASYESLKQSLITHADSQIRVNTQQWKINRYLETSGLVAEERYTGALAQAFGPGARTARMRAEIGRIGDEAELNAEARLSRDSTNTENADRERRIGINKMGAVRAEYLQNLTASEGNLFRTNLSNTAAGSPTEILNTIAKGIDSLSQKIGTLVATD